MSLFRSKSDPAAERPSVLLQLRLVDKFGTPIDASYAWEELKALFQNHKHLDISRCEIRPDTDEKTSI